MDPVPVKSASQNPSFSQSVLPTHTHQDALLGRLPGNGKIDVLLIPGGLGTREGPIDATVSFLTTMLYSPEQGFLRPQHIITICTGSRVLAQTTLLDGYRATTNKSRFGVIESLYPQVKWIAEARWVRDKIVCDAQAGAGGGEIDVWTSGGISAGIDVTLAFVGEWFGLEVARNLAVRMEYVWTETKNGEGDVFFGMLAKRNRGGNDGKTAS